MAVWTRSPIGTAFRSVLVPGWGQISTHRPGAARFFLFVTGLLAITGVTVFLFVEPVEVAARVADPDVLGWIVLLDLLVLVLRLVSTGMAWRDGGGHRWMAALFLAVIVAVPHVAIGWVGLETRNTLETVFAGPIAQAAAPPVTTTMAPTTTTTARPELSPIVAAPGQYESDVMTVSTTPGWEPFGSERLNVLLLGGDSGPGRSGLRTDTMIVASIDPVSGDAALVGLPRNFAGVTLTDGTLVPVTQLGHVYGWGAGHPGSFPESSHPGATATQDVIENLTGLEIDYFVLVDLTGFADVVDAFGGVTLDVTDPVDGPLYDVATGGYEMVRIEMGRQHLDGAHALAYSRARYGSTDYVRMGRQRCVLATMAAQSDLLRLFARLDDILAAVEQNLVTDIPVDLVPDLIRLTPQISASRIRMIGFDPSWGVGFDASGRAIPDVPRIREAVRVLIEDPGGSEAVGGLTAETGC